MILPPVETNFDIVVQKNVTPSAHLTNNLGQKDLRYLNVWSDVLACSHIGFHQEGNFIGAFSGSYNEPRDKPTFGAPGFYDILAFSPRQESHFDGAIK